MIAPDQKRKTKVVSINSSKGGAGKTTIALAIAKHYLDDSKTTGPVVLIDADILGTEISDCFPRNKEETKYLTQEPPEWALGLLNLLTESTGGNKSFEQWLTYRLHSLKKENDPKPSAGEPTKTTVWLDLPFARVSADQLAGVIIIPSFQSRTFQKRQEDRGGFRMDLVCDTLAVAHLRYRLTHLLKVLRNIINPEVIVIDNSPFELALGQAISDVLESVNVSPARRKKRETDGILNEVGFLDPDHFVSRQVHVFVPLEQDMIPQIQRMNELAKPDSKTTEQPKPIDLDVFVLNMDIHAKAAPDLNPEKQCPTVYEYGHQAWMDFFPWLHAAFLTIGRTIGLEKYFHLLHYDEKALRIEPPAYVSPDRQESTAEVWRRFLAELNSSIVTLAPSCSLKATIDTWKPAHWDTCLFSLENKG